MLSRFVRLDASRSTPGTGLGLSLVAAIAAYHRAKLQLADNRPGLVITLTFPVARGIDHRTFAAMRAEVRRQHEPA